MIKWTSRHTLIAGVMLILATQVVVLLGVAYNRSGTPQALLSLSQRELYLPYDNDADNSGLALRLRLRGLYAQEYGNSDSAGLTDWLNKEKLAALGFDLSKLSDIQSGSHSYLKRISRPVFLVFEFNGPAYQQALEKAQARLSRAIALGASNNGLAEARRALAIESYSASRLFLIDAGLDAQALRKQYGDTTRYLIIPGRIAPLVLASNENRPRLLTGRVSEVATETINVPAAFRTILEPIRQQIKGQRYEERENGTFGFNVTVAFGQRFEPWIVDLAPKQMPPHPE
ncbi:DUF4824 family protein [Pseudomonas fuscovaginae UPB0736]|uniref:DUF4824 family protein n=1 Tax=Pseudomonas asplenii TaxID=53407 RepID=A0A1H6P2Z9_9PSED|nr:DUF4824 family protein [Pseudomonas fuscovaginae]UUQ65450.1 DUF4824 family protein [Pseudomonas fuscovaginae UPB0736]SEI18188.1 protein of unknown function [Pseudomonas fuscovaginae]